MIHQLFPPPLLSLDSGLSILQLARIRDHLLELRLNDAGTVRSNRGGWHSAGNLFTAPFTQFDFLSEAVSRSLSTYVAEAFGHRGPAQLTLDGWGIVNRPESDFNAPHNHPGQWISGVLYVEVPPAMKGGEMVFLDPRPNVNALEMTRAPFTAPWFKPEIRVTPRAGEVLVFPGWLLHYVEPFSCSEPDAVRVALSFNASPVASR